MDDSSEDNLETNWVFVEEVDIAEEALALNTSKENLFTEVDNSLRSSFENISKSYSDSQLLLHEDKQNIDHDSESDGLSIISNWSYSQSTPDAENSDDGVDDKGTDETLIHSSEEIQHFNEKMENNVDENIETVNEEEPNDVDDGNVEVQNGVKEERKNVTDYEDVIVNNGNSHKLVEEVKDDIDNDQEALEQDEAGTLNENEVEEPLIHPERSFLTSSGESIFHYDPDLLEQLRWLEELPDDIPDTRDESTLQKYLISKIPQCIKKHFSVSGFLIGTVLIAASSVFLGTYFTASEPIQDELPTYQEKVFLYDVPGEENFEVPTALSFCREKHKSDDIYMEINAQKCLSKIEKRMKRKKYEKIVKEKIKSWEQQLEAKEKFLTEKEKNLRKRQLFSSKEMNDEKNYHKNNMRKCNKDYSKEKKHKHNVKNNEHKKYKDDSKEQMFEDDDKDVDKFATVDNFKHKQFEYKSKQKKYKGDSKEKVYKEDSKEKKYKDDSKEKLYKDNIRKDEKHKKNDDYKKNKEHQHINKIRSNENDYQKVKADYKKKYYEFSPKESSKEDKTRTTKETTCRSKNECKNTKNKYKQKYSPNFLVVDKKNDTVDGNWLGKLFKGRSEFRNKESTGEWYFDRSSYRKRKRDKAKWYFDWMMDREILRYRRLYLNL